MKENKALAKIITENINLEKKDYQKTVSFSQFSLYDECPYKWYLAYVKRLQTFTSTINTVFGTAIHETVQEYLTILFNKTVKMSEEFPIFKFFEESFRKNYLLEVAKNNGVNFSNSQEFAEFYEDGVEILKYIKARRKILYPVKDYELLGVEIPLRTQIKDDGDIFLFDGYIDIVLRDKSDGTIYIDDFKTSKNGWSKYEKNNETKMSQILLYKRFFSKQYKVPEEKIVPRFIILKRKLWEQAEFPQRRVQVHLPPHGVNKMKVAVGKIENFLNDVYSEDGKFIDKNYAKNPSPNNCRFCPFNDSPELCDKKNY
jgi:hypothetical protein